jgi:hypothetical protein
MWRVSAIMVEYLHAKDCGLTNVATAIDKAELGLLVRLKASLGEIFRFSHCCLALK